MTPSSEKGLSCQMFFSFRIVFVDCNVVYLYLEASPYFCIIFSSAFWSRAINKLLQHNLTVSKVLNFSMHIVVNSLPIFSCGLYQSRKQAISSIFISDLFSPSKCIFFQISYLQYILEIKESSSKWIA